jgi:arsenate reductase
MALEVLAESGISTEGLGSKSWSEFAAPGAPEIDFIFTVCDNAADEVCPIWPGKPISAHWGIKDPAAVEGPGQKEAFLEAMSYLRTRVETLVTLPLESMDEPTVQSRLREIGGTVGATRVSEHN